MPHSTQRKVHNWRWYRTQPAQHNTRNKGNHRQQPEEHQLPYCLGDITRDVRDRSGERGDGECALNLDSKRTGSRYAFRPEIVLQRKATLRVMMTLYWKGLVVSEFLFNKHGHLATHFRVCIIFSSVMSSENPWPTKLNVSRQGHNIYIWFAPLPKPPANLCLYLLGIRCS